MAPPDPDPVVLEVNLRAVHLSELRAAVAEQPDGSVRRALAVLARRALLLQEADRSGLGKGLPAEPNARASAWLDRVISERVICSNITERELRQTWSVMKPRFVRGDLYRVAELRWHCDADGDPEHAACLASATTWAQERWLPIVDSISGAEDLYWIGMLETPDEPLTFVEYTFHVAPDGRSSVPGEVALSTAGMETGTAQVAVAGAGARIQLLIEHRPPINRGLDDPGVRDELRAHICPRLVESNRRNYVEMLLGSASIRIKRDFLPANHDVPAEAFGP